MELKQVGGLKEVANLEDNESKSNLSNIQREIKTKKKVLDLIYTQLNNSADASEYADMMRYYQNLLSETTDDELALEILRLVKKCGGSRVDAVIALRNLNANE